MIEKSFISFSRTFISHFLSTQSPEHVSRKYYIKISEIEFRETRENIFRVSRIAKHLSRRARIFPEHLRFILSRIINF